MILYRIVRKFDEGEIKKVAKEGKSVWPQTPGDCFGQLVFFSSVNPIEVMSGHKKQRGGKFDLQSNVHLFVTRNNNIEVSETRLLLSRLILQYKPVVLNRGAATLLGAPKSSRGARRQIVL